MSAYIDVKNFSSKFSFCFFLILKNVFTIKDFPATEKGNNWVVHSQRLEQNRKTKFEFFPYSYCCMQSCDFTEKYNTCSIDKRRELPRKKITICSGCSCWTYNGACTVSLRFTKPKWILCSTTRNEFSLFHRAQVSDDLWTFILVNAHRFLLKIVVYYCTPNIFLTASLISSWGDSFNIIAVS